MSVVEHELRRVHQRPQQVLGRLSPLRYLRSLAGPIESAIFAYDDPLPGLLELPLMAWLAGKRLIQGRPV